eukprot:6375464-Ditylum_brightwellii.AAC.1
MGYRATTSSIKQCSKLSEHLHHTFVAGSLREMIKPGTKCFKVPELDETQCLKWDEETSEQMHTCMLGETVALANEESVKQEEPREPPPGVGVIDIGGISKPSGIGTIVFTITDCKRVS